jgi:hypothetical protein
MLSKRLEDSITNEIIVAVKPQVCGQVEADHAVITGSSECSSVSSDE